MHWILCRIESGLHLGFGLPIQGPNSLEGYNGTCRMCVESHGPPQQ